ncbi:hypothetical protein PLESTF_000390300 [Pleodorina starrii]|nr:hypothetical protein PLESTM_000519100 [Pleodorina starrii]GLC66149.1 hypothetical protein PLESTF_000390300 [Pleodorina starrii]
MPNWRPGHRSLLVIAHPDDESLFFANYISSAARAGVQVYVLCLSTGNADGLGHTRVHELYRACATLQIPKARISVVDDPDLQDGFRTWGIPAVCKHLTAAIRSIQPHQLVTFDSRGVSGHPNHTSIYRAVRHLIEAQRACASGASGDGSSGREPCRVYTLVTLPLPIKFTGLLGVLLSAAALPSGRSSSGGGDSRGSSSGGGAGDLVFLARDPSLCFRALCCHWSQLVWYRLLFVLFSTYTYANQLRLTGQLQLDLVTADR